jgi:hypothetical protein
LWKWSLGFPDEVSCTQCISSISTPNWPVLQRHSNWLKHRLVPTDRTGSLSSSLFRCPSPKVLTFMMLQYFQTGFGIPYGLFTIYVIARHFEVKSDETSRRREYRSRLWRFFAGCD